MTEDLELRQRGLIEDLAGLEEEAQRLRTSDGDSGELADKLAKVSAESSIVRTRLARATASLCEAKIEHLEQQKAEVVDRRNEMHSDILEHVADVEARLTSWFGSDQADAILHPGRSHQTDPAINSDTRLTLQEFDAARREDELGNELGRLNQIQARLEQKKAEAEVEASCPA